jgi:hypothetical protein
MKSSMVASLNAHHVPMTYLIAGVLLGAAVAILTLPWTRRDPDDFSKVELGYAWRGPRGAVAGAIRVLMDEGAARRSRRRGIVRTGERLPRGLDPLARSVYSGLGNFEGLSQLRNLMSVRDRMPAVARPVIDARLRDGRVRRTGGTLVALAAPVVALVTLAREVTTTGIVVSVVTVLGAGWLIALRGVTIRGARTLSAVPRPAVREGARRGGVLAGGTPAGWMLADFGYPTSSFAIDMSDLGGGHHSGGYDGGGHHGGDFGGDSGGHSGY